MLLYIWKKPDDEFVCRLKKDYFPLYKIGEKNSFGWTLVSIQCIYNYRFYDYYKIYNLKIEKNKKKKKKKFFKKYIYKHLIEILILVLCIFIFFKIY